ncbi:hypothetical protein [Streptosporangium sp. NPDC051022]
MDAGLDDGAVSVHAADLPGRDVRRGRRRDEDRWKARVRGPR